MTDSKPDGRIHLGRMEWAAVLALLGGFGWFAQQQLSKLGTLDDSVNALKTQQAVTNGQMQTLTTQLADVPRLTREMSEMKVRVERVEQDVRDIQRR